MTYLFVLGREPALSAAEIRAVLAQEKIQYAGHSQTNDYLTITAEGLDAPALMRRLGGTIKIAELIGEGEESDDIIAEHIQKTVPEGKIHFSVHSPHAKKHGLAIKKQLVAAGRSARYVEATNAAAIAHNRLVERGTDYTIADNAVFVTRAVQDIAQWGERDYGRPSASPSSGMLPPKLARIMINLSGATAWDVLLDPFCGSGTVLMEALDLGFTRVVGSDHSPQAVVSTKKNIEWFAKKHLFAPASYAIYTLDARKLEEKIKPASIDVIVSEPYLGKPLHGRETEEKLGAAAGELAGLYADAFASFARVLKKNGVVVFIIPRFKTKGGWIDVPCIESITLGGFEIVPLTENPDEPFLSYHRADQRLARAVWKFRKKR